MGYFYDSPPEEGIFYDTPLEGFFLMIPPVANGDRGYRFISLSLYEDLILSHVCHRIKFYIILWSILTVVHFHF